jgi:integrase/recombinase XerC
MATDRRLAAVPYAQADRTDLTAAGSLSTSVPMAEALASFLRHQANRCGRSGRITSPETVRSSTSALPKAFAGITNLAELGGPGRIRLHANIRDA